MLLQCNRNVLVVQGLSVNGYARYLTIVHILDDRTLIYVGKKYRSAVLGDEHVHARYVIGMLA